MRLSRAVVCTNMHSPSCDRCSVWVLHPCSACLYPVHLRPHTDSPLYRTHRDRYGAINDFTQADKQSPVGRLLGGHTVKGIAGWLFWRSAYLTTLGSWRNRLQVGSAVLRAPYVHA